MAEEKNSMVGKKIKAVPKEPQEIGIDTKEVLMDTVLADTGVDISKLQGFSTVTQTREQIYRMIDTMGEDPILASYLKTFSEDSVETNDSGQVIWCESYDGDCAKYVTYLLDSINADKNAYRWMHSLIKYGDLYLKLYRQSDYEDDEIFSEKQQEERKKLDESLDPASSLELKENVNVVLHEKKDHYVPYVEMVPNPGEMFELTKRGKTMGFIHAPINIQNGTFGAGIDKSYMFYKMKQHDVDIYSPLDFVHACLEDNSSRVPEKVDITTQTSEGKDGVEHSYTVKRGQSELAPVFTIWRELTLLENSAILSRVTKSSIVRTVGIEVGNMPKEQVGATLQSVKNLFEQKNSLKQNEGMGSFTNPGPIENFIYYVTRQGIGNIVTGTVGGDFDPKQFTDINHFQDKLFGALGIPKQYFGVTEDGAGFNGGQSLSIISSRYGKSVKRVQNTFCQMITDLVNLFLLDRGLTRYINKFTIRMQAPVTQEELDRRENKKNRIGVVNDVMMLVQDISDPVVKMKILKTLLADSITDNEVISLLQGHIEELEKEPEEPEPETDDKNNPTEHRHEESPSAEPMPAFEPSEPMEFESPSSEEPGGETVEPISSEGSGDSYLPSPQELNIDATDNTNF